MAERPPVGPQYRIGTVSRLTGLTTHVIRVWERRYGALTPPRNEAGARLYSDADLVRLRLLKGAIESGHTISQVATLREAALNELQASGRAQGPSRATDEQSEFAEEFVNAVQALDLARAEQALSGASIRFSPRVLVTQMLGPVLQLVGERWETGELCAASEHAASGLVRNLLGSLLREYSVMPSDGAVVLTTLAGELHEFGALLGAVTVAMQGFRAVYLGPNLPASEIALAVRASAADAVAVSIVALDARLAVKELGKLAKLTQGVQVVLGGVRALAVQRQLNSAVHVCSNLVEFEHWLSHGLRSGRKERLE